MNEKLLKLRKEKGLSQEELANLLNVSRQSISKWELGDTTPELSKVVEIAKYYKVSTDYLLLENHDELSTDNDQHSKDKNMIIIIVAFSLGMLLLCVSIILTQIIPHDINTNHSGLIAYVFEDWTLWGITWRFLMFIPGLVLLFTALIKYLKGKKHEN